MSPTLRMLFKWNFLLVSRELLGFSLRLCLYHTHLKILFHWITTLVSRAFPIGLLCMYIVHFWDSLSLDCYVRIWRSLVFSFNGLLRLYLAQFKYSLSTVCCISFLCIFGILSDQIVTSVSRTLLDSLSLNCYVDFSFILRILFD